MSSGRPGTVGNGFSSIFSISWSNAPSASPSLWNAQSGSSLHWARNVVQRRLEPGRLLQRSFELVGVRVGGTVEDGGPHGVGEQRRPRAAELGAVAEPEVADLVLAERPANRVHVAGRVVGADELDEVLAALDALVGEVLGDVDDLLALGVVVGGDVGAGVVVVVVVDAVDERLALAGAAGVPADDVEAVEEVRAVDELGRLGEDRPAEAGSAGVDEQRADARDRDRRRGGGRGTG